jgi:hypothetical protein
MLASNYLHKKLNMGENIKMTWLLWIVGIVGFFYIVGRLTKKPQELLVSVSRGETTTIYKTKREKYLPWTDEPYHHIHLFELFGTDAGLGWNDGDEAVDVYCISRFSKGEPQTKVYSSFNYSIGNKIWNEPPKGAAKECLGEIKRALKL